MVYIYMKPEVKNSHTAETTTTVDKASVVWLCESCYLGRGFFLLLDRILPLPRNSEGCLYKFDEVAGQSIPDGGNNKE